MYTRSGPAVACPAGAVDQRVWLAVSTRRKPSAYGVSCWCPLSPQITPYIFRRSGLATSIPGSHIRHQQQLWSGSRMFLLQQLWLEKGYERHGRRQMFDTPSNLTTGNEKHQLVAVAGRRM